MARFTKETAKKAGKKSKRGESKKTKAIKELLSPHADDVSLQLVISAKDGQPWAVKLFMEYLYGKPKQEIDFNQAGDIEINVNYVKND